MEDPKTEPITTELEKEERNRGLGFTYMKGKNIRFVPTITPQMSQFQPLLQGVVVVEYEGKLVVVQNRES